MDLIKVKENLEQKNFIVHIFETAKENCLNSIWTQKSILCGWCE